MQPHILIDQAICTRCNLCVEVCPNKILFPDEEHQIAIRPDRMKFCFSCGQCMAVCPEKSISVGNLSYESILFDLPPTVSYDDCFYNLIATRRAIRNFKDKPVPEELLEKIVEAISFAPPGFPPVKTELIVVQDRDLIRNALPHMVDLYDGLLHAFRNPVSRFFIKREVGSQRFHTMKDHLIPLLKTRMAELKAGAEDTITRNAPAMILFCGDRAGEDIQADVYIAATYGMLAVHSLGLGGSVMDLIPPAIERSKPLRKMFNLSENTEVIASIIIGYPRYKYLRGIKRPLRSVQWRKPAIASFHPQ